MADADYGLKIWNKDGDVRLDTTDHITRVAYSVVASAGVSSGITLPEAAGIDGEAVALALADSAGKATTQGMPHNVSYTKATGYLSWGAVTSGEYYDGVDSLVILFLYS